MDWSGKVLETFSSASQVTSGLAVSDTALYVLANNETDYPPPYTGVHNLGASTDLIQCDQHAVAALTQTQLVRCNQQETQP